MRSRSGRRGGRMCRTKTRAPRIATRRRFGGRRCVQRRRRARRTAMPETRLPTSDDPAFWKRFWRHVDKDGQVPPHNPELGPCWNWIGAGSTKAAFAYGQIRFAGRLCPAHRIVCHVLVDALGSNDQALHRCDNPRCVRPDHLFRGSQADNIRDCSAKDRIQRQRATWTHCLNGHPFTPENTYKRKDRVARQCRTCRRAAQRRYKAT